MTNLNIMGPIAPTFSELGQCHDREPIDPFTEDLLDLNDVLIELRAKLVSENSHPAVVRFLEECLVVGRVEGNILLWRDGQDLEVESAYGSIDALHQILADGALDVGLPKGVRGFLLATQDFSGVDEHANISQKHWLPLVQPECAPSGHQDNQPDTFGDFTAMDDLDNDSSLELASDYTLTPDSIVETAAIVLSVSVWSIRGLSTTLKPDTRARGLLAFCFIALRLSDVDHFASYMNYTSQREILDDARRGKHLMACSPRDARAGKALLGELSALFAPPFRGETADELNDGCGDGNFSLELGRGDNFVQMNRRANSSSDNGEPGPDPFSFLYHDNSTLH